ncbi:FtsX-like permease family protein [Shewanella sedimentimangrovi]|uniref:ABC transporter permease n=1 Tax=Shewanella sedimentimangrovi TaxID=2814293 RepID=A0ABX7R230_9GAMM|nr:FtsX-like permease family protein [Shewanella sedimentimangrovi]QSX37876.1 ABC transporter permease [Shewanella sedimentimangrovi]
MAELAPLRSCLRVFAGHYRRSPLQAGAILLGIALAVCLLVGVKAINDNALRSYREATEPLSGRAGALLLPAAGATTLDETLYFRLRRAGLGPVLAELSGPLTRENGPPIYLHGTDLLAAVTGRTLSAPERGTSNSRLPQGLPLARLLGGEPLLLMSRSQAEKLAGDGHLKLSGGSLEVLALDEDFGLGSTIVADIGLAQRLLNMPGRLSAIVLLGPWEETQLKQALAQHGITEAEVSINVQDRGEALTQLTGSFHLSLRAMSLLAFVVGLFIAYNGVRYSLMKRTALLVQLQQLGLRRRELMAALGLELLLMVLLGSILGFVIGLQLSKFLQPLVALTLEQVYGARLLPGHWQASWLWQALGLTAVASLAACGPLYYRLLWAPLSHSRHQSSELGYHGRVHGLQLKLAVALLVLAALFAPFVSGAMQSLLLLGLLAISTPLLLPALLARLPRALAARLKYRGRAHYALAESSELAPAMSLAMMALFLALSAKIAMATLVGSFESTLTRWLEQRLHADIYLRPGGSQMAQVMTQLSADPRVKQVYRQWVTDLTVRVGDKSLPVELLARDKVSLAVTSTLKQADDELWQTMLAQALPQPLPQPGPLTQNTEALVLVNEPMALAQGLAPGDVLRLQLAGQEFGLTIAGIYYDHGNQQHQLLISEALWHRLGLIATPYSLALDCDCDAAGLVPELARQLHLNQAQIYSQQDIKAGALAMFGRTFDITAVLGSLTLLVAAVGLFSALSMLGNARETALARLYALGLSRGEILAICAAQMLLMVLITALLALPVAALLGWVLIHKMILLSFGWSLVMEWQWLAAAKAVLTALLAAALALAWPLYRQARRPLVYGLQREDI